MEADLSKIKCDSKLVNMLIEMDSFIREGRLTQEQLPIGDLSALIVEEIVNKDYPECKKNVTLGALEGVVNELRDEPMDTVSFGNHIRQIIAYIL